MIKQKLKLKIGDVVKYREDDDVIKALVPYYVSKKDLKLICKVINVDDCYRPYIECLFYKKWEAVSHINRVASTSNINQSETIKMVHVDWLEIVKPFYSQINNKINYKFLTDK